MNEKLKSFISKELKQCRFDKDETLIETAERTGLSKDLISRYENGSPIQMDSMAILLDHYETDFEIFFKKVYTKMYSKVEKEE